MSLERYIEAHKNYYDIALEEIKNGQKKTHWIWFIFPQFAGMGQSKESFEYGIVSLKEAKEFYANDYLRGHLLGITKALLNVRTRNLEVIVGFTDPYKIRSCMTLFYKATGDEIFRLVLDKYLDGDFDPVTLKLLETYDEKEISTVEDYNYVHEVTKEYFKAAGACYFRRII